MAGTSEVPNGNRFVIRPFEPPDRDAVRRICADTGFLGEPIDPIFEDRELFADFLTGYHLDWEPESAFVLEMDGRVAGYLLGCRRHWRRRMYQMLHGSVLLVKLLWRYISRPYTAVSRKYLKWFFFRSWREKARIPDGLPTFHIEVLREARSIATTVRLIDAFLHYLADKDEVGVVGQLLTFDKRRSDERAFARYGWKLVDRRPSTRFSGYSSTPVYVSTLVKMFREGVGLYDHDVRPET
ncbi:MAG: GNAT family acetyltransferase [Kiritimatiellia bacterium]